VAWQPRAETPRKIASSGAEEAFTPLVTIHAELS
jgi:hypothetical protein